MLLASRYLILPLINWFRPRISRQMLQSAIKCQAMQKYNEMAKRDQRILTSCQIWPQSSPKIVRNSPPKTNKHRKCRKSRQVEKSNIDQHIENMKWVEHIETKCHNRKIFEQSKQQTNRDSWTTNRTDSTNRKPR